MFVRGYCFFFPPWWCQEKDFYSKVILQSWEYTLPFFPLFIFYIYFPSSDRDTPQKTDKTPKWFWFSIWFTGIILSHRLLVPLQSHTHADSLIDSTKEETMVSVLYQLSCWWDWLRHWSSGGAALSRICSLSTGSLINDQSHDWDQLDEGFLLSLSHHRVHAVLQIFSSCYNDLRSHILAIIVNSKENEKMAFISSLFFQ